MVSDEGQRARDAEFENGGMAIQQNASTWTAPGATPVHSQWVALGATIDLTESTQVLIDLTGYEEFPSDSENGGDGDRDKGGNRVEQRLKLMFSRQIKDSRKEMESS